MSGPEQSTFVLPENLEELPTLEIEEIARQIIARARGILEKQGKLPKGLEDIFIVYVMHTTISFLKKRMTTKTLEIRLFLQDSRRFCAKCQKKNPWGGRFRSEKRIV